MVVILSGYMYHCYRRGCVYDVCTHNTICTCIYYIIYDDRCVQGVYVVTFSYQSVVMYV